MQLKMPILSPVAYMDLKLETETHREIHTEKDRETHTKRGIEKEKQRETHRETEK